MEEENQKICYMATNISAEGLASEVTRVYSMLIDTPLAENEIAEAIEFQISTAKECLENPGFLSPNEIKASIHELSVSLDRLSSILQYLKAREFIFVYSD